ncbi:MAG: hypothetical protein AAB388_00570 [Patescibacteria group bacterium]
MSNIIVRGEIYLFVLAADQSEEDEPVVIRFSFSNLQLPAKDKIISIHMNSELVIDAKPIVLLENGNQLLATAVLEPRAYKILLSEVDITDRTKTYYRIHKTFDLRHTITTQ